MNRAVIYRNKLDPIVKILKWLEPVSSTFQDVDYNHCILVDTRLIVSNICPIIAEYVAISFMTQ